MFRWGSNDANDLCQLILGRNGNQFVWRYGGNLQERDGDKRLVAVPVEDPLQTAAPTHRERPMYESSSSSIRPEV